MDGPISEDEGNAMEEITPEPDAPKRRGRPVGSRNKVKDQIIEAPQPRDPMYTAMMERLDAMDGVLAERQRELAQRHTELGKKEKAPSKPPRAPRAQVSSRSLERPTTSSADAFLDNIHRAREEQRQKRERLYASFLP